MKIFLYLCKQISSLYNHLKYAQDKLCIYITHLYNTIITMNRTAFYAKLNRD